jgi:CRISPR-associated protein Cas5a/b/c
VEPWLLTVHLEFAWGYSVRLPTYGKRQSSFPLPPPSTLLGALAYPLMLDSGEYYLETKNLVGSAQKLRPFVLAASACFSKDSRATLTEDVNRYLIGQFQRKGRRTEPSYRFGAVPVGKVYAPSQEMILAFALDGEKCSSVLGEDWGEKLVAASYSIVRIGSKEGLVSVKLAKLQRAAQINGERIKTGFYMPQSAVIDPRSVTGDYYMEEFWDPDYSWGKPNKTSFYIVPGRRNPVQPGIVEANVTHAVKAGEYELAF